MAEWEREPSGHAEQLLHDELLNEILDAIERDAIETVLAASPGDDHKRRFHSMEANAIRSVRRQLAERASGKAKPRRNDPSA